MRSYEREVVLAACCGKYNILANYFLPMISEAVRNGGKKHIPDPFKPGSKDGFRVYKDFNEKGISVFNNNFGKSSFSANFFQLMELAGVSPSFAKSLEMVGTYLGCPRTGPHIKGTPFNDEVEQQKASEYMKKAQELAQAQQALAKKERAEAYKQARANIDKVLPYLIPLSDLDKSEEAWKYLENRGLKDLKKAPELLSNVFYNPKTPYYQDGKVIGYFGSICSKVFAGSKEDLWSIHRIFIKDGKKANVACPKKMMGTRFDASGMSKYIKFGEIQSHGVLGIAEGIETALSCAVAMRGIPVWSAVNAGNLLDFEPPKGVHTVLVFADKDANSVGQNDAQKLINKLRAEGILGIRVLPKTAIPEGSKGIDWNDILINEGTFGFPDIFQVFKYIKEQKIVKSNT